MLPTPKTSSGATNGTGQKTDHVLVKQATSSPLNPLFLLPPTNLSGGLFGKLCSDIQLTVMKHLFGDDHLSLSLTSKSAQSAYGSTVWPFRFILKDNKVVMGCIAKGKNPQQISDKHPLCRLPRSLFKDQKGMDAAIQFLRSGVVDDKQGNTREEILAQFQTHIASLREKGLNDEADAISYQLLDVAIELQTDAPDTGSFALRSQNKLICAKVIYASFQNKNAVDEITIEALIRENQISRELWGFQVDLMDNYLDLPDFNDVAEAAAEKRPMAAYQLGMIYLKGKELVFLKNNCPHIEPDIEKARKYLTTAATNGCVLAEIARRDLPEPEKKETCVIC